MSRWQIIVPAYGRNLCANPSFETGVAGGWGNRPNVVRTQSLEYAKFGLNSMKCDFGGTVDSLAYLDFTPVADTSYWFSAWVYVPTVTWVHDTIRMSENTAATFSDAVITYLNTYDPNADGFDKWVYLSTRIDIGTDVTGSLAIDLTGSGGATLPNVYVDGVNLTDTSPSTFIDGDQPGCRWLDIPHGSGSEREANTRAGGTIINIGDDLSFHLQSMEGVGAPPVETLYTQRSLMPGAQVQRQRVLPRVFTLVSETPGGSLDNLHELRNAMMDAITPDGSPSGEPVIIRYNGTKITKEIRALYTGGLQLSGPSGFSERIGLQFSAFEWPFFEEVGNSGKVVDTVDNVTMESMMRRIGNRWDNFSVSTVTLGAGTHGFYKDTNGRIFACGWFTDLDGVAAADFVARYNEDTDTWIGYGFAIPSGSGHVTDIVVDPSDGDIYVCGWFDNANSDANQDRISRYNGSTWEALTGTAGMNNFHRMTIERVTGDLWCVGAFQNVNAIANADGVAVWSGTAWSAVGTGTLQETRCITQDAAGNMWVAGDITTIGGTTVKRIAYWDGSAWINPTGFNNGSVYDIMQAPNGDIYACGTFTTLDDGVTTANRIARFNGKYWQPLGEGIADGTARSMAWVDGQLYVGGDFTEVGGLTGVEGLAVWNGTTWHRIDLGSFTSGEIYRLKNFGDNRLYVGFYWAETITTSGETLCNNEGNAKAYPVITVARSGGTSARLQHLINDTTGAKINIEYDLADGETLTLDLRPGQRSMVSDVFGKLWKLLPGSQISDFYLQPGENSILTFVDQTGGTITSDIQWRDTYMGID